MSLYGPTFHVSLVDLCIRFQCKLYIYPVSCLVEIKLLFQIDSKKFNSMENLRCDYILSFFVECYVYTIPLNI